MWHSTSTLTNQCALHWRALSQVFKIQNTPKQTPPVEVEKIVYIEVEKVVYIEVHAASLPKELPPCTQVDVEESQTLPDS